MAHSETILDAVVTAVSAIHTDSGASFTPAIVQRFDRYKAQKGRLPNIQISRGPLTLDREEFGGNWRVDLAIDLQCAILHDKSTNVSTDKAVNLAAEDIAEAIIGMDWDALGSTLVRVESTPFEEVDENEPDDGIMVTCGIQYKLAFDNLDTVVDPS